MASYNDDDIAPKPKPNHHIRLANLEEEVERLYKSVNELSEVIVQLQIVVGTSDAS
jgi:hypothetical protein